METHVKKIMEDRIERLRKIIVENNLDTFLILTEENRKYLSGYTGEDTGHDESAGALFITADKLLLATDSRFEFQAMNEAPDFEIHIYQKGLAHDIPEIVEKLNIKRLGFEGGRLSYAQYESFVEKIKSAGLQTEMIDAGPSVEDFRIIKSDDEISIMKKALYIAENAFLNVKSKLAPGMTEKELAWAMETQMRENGAEGLSFPTIIASGPNSALPHATPGDREIGTGEPILFDWGARYQGYCSDTSRTLVLGKPDEMFERVYATLFEAQRLAIEAIRAGVSSRDVDSIARNYIDKKGFEGAFGHGLGHGVGIAIHEPPRLSPVKNSTLKAGMVITVEPGIYVKEWGGIRLENMVVVREDGAEVLNTLDYNDYTAGN